MMVFVATTLRTGSNYGIREPGLALTRKVLGVEVWC